MYIRMVTGMLISQLQWWCAHSAAVRTLESSEDGKSGHLWIWAPHPGIWILIGNFQYICNLIYSDHIDFDLVIFVCLFEMVIDFARKSAYAASSTHYDLQGPNPLYISKNDPPPKFIKSGSGGREHII